MPETTYQINEDTSSIRIERTFEAPRKLVWRAWTDPELLDQWWAPKPWKTVTKAMDLRSGGKWVYSMINADGERQWCQADYSEISDGYYYKATDYFSDENGIPSPDFKHMRWHVRFEDEDERTKVVIDVNFFDDKEMERLIEMGFQDGISATHRNLDELLEEVQEKTN